MGEVIPKKLVQIEEEEVLIHDQEKLRQYQKSQKKIHKMDEFHNQFYDYWEKKYPEKKLTIDKVFVLKEFVEFVKQNTQEAVFIKVILYSTDCPKCKILQEKLNEKGIDYEKISDTDIMLKK